MRPSRIALVLLLAAVVLGRGNPAEGIVLPLFERYLGSLRQQAGIPGLSAAIVQHGRIVWERGFGLSDVERSIPALPNTPYPVGDLTQTFAAVLALQCAERGTLQLDEPLARWTALVSAPGVTVRQVLSHASDGAFPRSFRYDPVRYAALSQVVEGCANEPFRKALADEILDRLGMVDSVPGRDLVDPLSPARTLFEPERLERYAGAIGRLASPYRLDRRGRPVPSEDPEPGINAATGLISTVRDLARYDGALDDAILLRPETRELAWSNGGSETGVALPTGLGWFVQHHNGRRLVWHFGLSAGAYSSLMLKVPDQDLTLILLANSDGLSAPFRLAEGDVTSSVFARVFLQLFL